MALNFTANQQAFDGLVAQINNLCATYKNLKANPPVSAADQAVIDTQTSNLTAAAGLIVATLAPPA